ncbi:hypothetical protein E2C01_031689 [Portunus trituberculatus]|uniref:Uncharacterized protein n=1 Tax=Portunus trituberculatus TaxID=210409 RepID=A0A5B7EYA4_PORTR|nr:hypothetical protein [Portunus trituberculatus]
MLAGHRDMLNGSRSCTVVRSLSVTPGGRTGRGIFSMLPGLRSTTGEETNPSAPHACTYLVTHRLSFTLQLSKKATDIVI